MSEVFSILCRRADGVPKRFSCTCEWRAIDDAWIFRAHVIGDHLDGKYFEATYENVGSSVVRQIAINHYGVPDYKHQGIPDALIPTVARFLRRTVLSSSRSGSGDFRTPDAETMWKRLCAAGIARRNPASDRYEVDPGWTG